MFVTFLKNAKYGSHFLTNCGQTGSMRTPNLNLLTGITGRSLAKVSPNFDFQVFLFQNIFFWPKEKSHNRWTLGIIKMLMTCWLLSHIYNAHHEKQKYVSSFLCHTLSIRWHKSQTIGPLNKKVCQKFERSLESLTKLLPTFVLEGFKFGLFTILPKLNFIDMRTHDIKNYAQKRKFCRSKRCRQFLGVYAYRLGELVKKVQETWRKTAFSKGLEVSCVAAYYSS